MPSREDPPIVLISSPRWYYGLMLLAAFTLAGTSLLAVHSASSVEQSVGWVDHTQDLILRLGELSSNLYAAESAQRGYLISRNAEFLAQYNKARADVVADMHTLEQAGASDDVARLGARVHGRLSFADETLLAVALGQPIDIAARISGSGEFRTQLIRAQIRDLLARERAQLDARRGELDLRLAQINSTVIIANGLALAAGLIGVIMMVRSRRARERQQQAELAAERARVASEEKSAFLANMSHEIRTPMNAIFGFTQLLAGRVHGEQEKRYVEAIATSGRALLSLINDILDLSRIEAGRLEFEPVATDVRELIDSSLSVFVQMASEKRLSLRADISPELPPALVFDPMRLRQVLFNLIGNALKYTETGGVRVTARAESAADGRHVDLLVDVIDSGIGIAPDQLSTIFSPFVQGRPTDGRTREGTGLGLSITRRLLEHMGGSIDVRSEPGRGSTFSVRLRGLEAALRPALAHEPLADQTGLDALPPMQILVVDDVPWNRELLKAYFDGTRHRTLLADSGEQAVELARRHPPDLVLMDIRMPGMGGSRARELIKADPSTAAARIVAVTASSLADEEAGLRRQFDGYLRKPVSRADLLGELRRVLGVHEHADAAGPAAPVTSRMASREAVDGESIARLRVLIGTVWPRLLATRRMREVGAFASEVADLGARTHCEVLAEYGRRLARCVSRFDVVAVESLLAQFPQHAHTVPGMADAAATDAGNVPEHSDPEPTQA